MYGKKLKIGGVWSMHTWTVPCAWLNSLKIIFLNTMANVFCPYNAPILNLSFSLQNGHERTNDHMMNFHAMWWMIWKIHVIRSNMQKEALNLEFWIKSYGLLKFHAHLAMIWSYLLNHSSDAHDLGLFGNGRERSSTFMLDKISFEASLMLESWVEVGPKTCHFWKLEITGHFPFLETFAMTSKSSR